MDFADFCQNYSDAQFCLVNDNYKYSFLKSTLSKKHGAYFKVTINKKGNYFFTVNQRSKRKYSPSMQETFEYSQITMVVAKMDGDDKFTYIEGKQKADREVWTAKGEEAELETGVYIVYIKCLWNYNEENSMCFSVYGASTVEIAELLRDECKMFFPKVYLDYAKKVSEKKKNQAPKFNAPNTFICIDQTDDGYAFAAVWNDDSDRKIKCEFRFKNLVENKMRLKGKFHNDSVASFVVEPGEDMIVVVRIKDSERACLSFSQSISMEPATKKK